MYADTHKIAQAEFAIFVARVNTPAHEGYTVKVPNVIDLAIAAVKNLFMRNITARPVKVTISHGAPAK